MIKYTFRLCLAALALTAALLAGCTGTPEQTTDPAASTSPSTQAPVPSETTLPAETTVPPETTLPPETTVPPETTLPPETTIPTEPAVLIICGDYTVNEVMLDEGGVSNVDCGVTLREDGSCMLYMGWGMWHEGPWEIQGDLLLCHSTKLEWDGGGGPGSRETDVVFTFAIRGENLLELTDIAINDPDTHNLVSPTAFSVGMTYSIQG